MANESLIIKTSTLPKSRIAIELEIPASRCKSCIEETINTLSRSAKLPGFRAGKIPKQVLIQRIGLSQIHASALEKIIDKAWNEALKQESIEPLSEPALEDGFESLLEKFNPENNLKVTLQTDIAPELKLKKVKGISVEIKENTFDPKSIDDALEQSRKQLANIIPVKNRPAKIGDIAVISFEGKYKDTQEKIEGGTSESMDLELETNKMIPGFVEGIVGMKINDKKTLDLKFPNDYAHEDSKGKEAIFEVKLKDLKTKELPELNDEFAKQSGNKNSLKELKKDIENQLRENFENSQKDLRVEALIDALTKELEVEIPQSMIDIEVRNSIEQTAQRFAQQGLDIKSTFTPELIKSLAESSRPQAEKTVLQSLALKALSEAENIQISEKEVDQKILEYQDEISKTKRKINLKKLREAIKSDLLKEKLIVWLEKNCEIKKVKEKKSDKKAKSKNTSKSKTTSKANNKQDKKSSSSKSIQKDSKAKQNK